MIQFNVPVLLNNYSTFPDGVGGYLAPTTLSIDELSGAAYAPFWQQFVAPLGPFDTFYLLGLWESYSESDSWNATENPPPNGWKTYLASEGYNTDTQNTHGVVTKFAIYDYTLNHRFLPAPTTTTPTTTSSSYVAYKQQILNAFLSYLKTTIGVRTILVDFVSNHVSEDVLNAGAQAAYPIYNNFGVQHLMNLTGTALAKPILPVHTTVFGGQTYAHATDGSFTWDDSLNLDYRKADTVATAICVITSILENSRATPSSPPLIDGFRCDLSHLLLNQSIYGIWGATTLGLGLLNEPWHIIVGAVRRIFAASSTAANAAPPHNVLFFGEAYWDDTVGYSGAVIPNLLLACGFNWLYYKRVMDLLTCPFAVGTYKAQYLSTADFNGGIVQPGLAQKLGFALATGTGDNMACFLENHDEYRALDQFWPYPNDISTLTAPGQSSSVLPTPLAALMHANLLAMLLPGMNFFYDGQLVGRVMQTSNELNCFADFAYAPLNGAAYTNRPTFAETFGSSTAAAASAVNRPSPITIGIYNIVLSLIAYVRNANQFVGSDYTLLSAFQPASVGSINFHNLTGYAMATSALDKQYYIISNYTSWSSSATLPFTFAFPQGTTQYTVTNLVPTPLTVAAVRAYTYTTTPTVGMVASAAQVASSLTLSLAPYEIQVLELAFY